jgi:Zn-dependent peptidase ImmA (M78 family)/transcriptional regulator with XRE-family HTH domain
MNPNMLVLARESRGVTQFQLAGQLGISQANVSKLEAGLLAVDAELLGRIARALKYPVRFFSQPDPVFGYGSSCLYHRKRQSLPVHDLRRITAELNVLRIGVSRLLQGVEVESAHRFPRMDLADFEDSPEYIAQLIRGAWALPSGPVQNLTRAIENAGGIVVRCSFGTTKLDAISQWVPGMPPLFFVNAEIPTDRFRFSLAHELGHVVMHQIPTNDLETEADRFASEILMPAKEIAPHLSPLSIQKLAQMKPYWKTSMAALAKRAHDLGKISPRHYRTLFTQMGTLGLRIQEPVPLPPEEPELLMRIIDVHRKQQAYSIEELSDLVAVYEPEFRSRYLREQGRLRIVG